MKKIKLIISLVCVGLAVIICAIMVHFSNENFVEDVFLGDNIDHSVDEYLISQGYVKFPEKEKGVWLTENTDTDFDKNSEKLNKTLEALGKSFFDSVFVRSEYFSSPSKEFSYSENLSDISNVASLIKEKGKKVYLEVHTDSEEYVFGDVASLCDGIILRNDKKMSAEKFNLLLSKSVRSIRKYNKDIKILVYLSLDYDISKLNKKSVDGVCTFIGKDTDFSVVSRWDKTLKLSDSDFYCTLDINSAMKSKKTAKSALENIYELRNCENLSAVVFSSFESVSKDKNGAFSAVEEYLTKGIVPDIAFRDLDITGYDGSLIQTNLFAVETEVCGSNLYPCYLNGKEIDLGEKGSKKITFNLSEGVNEFSFSQCGKTVKYKVKMNFDGEIIRSVMPGETVTVQPGEKITVTVIAYTGADITVKVGTKEYKAKCESGVPAGYAAFTAKIKMPESRQQVESLGMISVIGSLGETTVQQKGAMIICGEEMTTLPPEPTQGETTTAIKLGNFVEELINDKYEYTPPPTTAPVTQTATVPYTPITNGGVGSVMCVVTAPYADTWPLIYNDDTYTPFYSTLVQGTMDYVTAQSSAYNSRGEEIAQFYELASGRKVNREDVQLIYHTVNDNRMEVMSTRSENGTLTIKLKTDWRVPYSITHTPQNYYSAHSSKYNINAFNANYIQIDFYHTTSVSGSVNVNGSTVVSSASWSVSPEEKRATLYMPLSLPGKYFGTSVEYDENGNMVIRIQNNPGALQGAVILLDPGHGGNDPGALGINKQVHESDINLAVAYAVRDELISRGATVYLTRQGNETLSLEQRRLIAHNIEPDLFVSIHSNGSERSSDIGTAVYYYKGFSQPLANNIYGEMISVFKNNLYYGQQNLYDDLSDGDRYYPFYVARIEDCPAVLIETGYVTNDAECYKLIESSTHRLFGQAIANGIEKTLS